MNEMLLANRIRYLRSLHGDTIPAVGEHANYAAVMWIDPHPTEFGMHTVSLSRYPATSDLFRPALSVSMNLATGVIGSVRVPAYQESLRDAGLVERQAAVRKLSKWVDRSAAYEVAQRAKAAGGFWEGAKHSLRDFQKTVMSILAVVVYIMAATFLMAHL